MTSRLYTIAELEEANIKAQEARIKAEEDVRKLEEAMIKAEEENARKLEEARIRAEEDARKLEEEKLILRLLISGTSIKEISAKQSVTEEYIKSLLEGH